MTRRYETRYNPADAVWEVWDNRPFKGDESVKMLTSTSHSAANRAARALESTEPDPNGLWVITFPEGPSKAIVGPLDEAGARMLVEVIYGPSAKVHQLTGLSDLDDQEGVRARAALAARSNPEAILDTIEKDLTWMSTRAGMDGKRIEHDAFKDALYAVKIHRGTFPTNQPQPPCTCLENAPRRTVPATGGWVVYTVAENTDEHPTEHRIYGPFASKEIATETAEYLWSDHRVWIGPLETSVDIPSAGLEALAPTTVAPGKTP